MSTYTNKHGVQVEVEFAKEPGVLVRPQGEQVYAKNDALVTVPPDSMKIAVPRDTFDAEYTEGTPEEAAKAKEQGATPGAVLPGEIPDKQPRQPGTIKATELNVDAGEPEEP